MRSIGKRNIGKVQQLTREAIQRRKSVLGLQTTFSGIEEEVIEKLPVELWDSWEMADQEIRRIINDEIWRI